MRRAGVVGASIGSLFFFSLCYLVFSLLFLFVCVLRGGVAETRGPFFGGRRRDDDDDDEEEEEEEEA